jgi:hypothetical protein
VCLPLQTFFDAHVKSAYGNTIAASGCPALVYTLVGAWVAAVGTFQG